MFETLRLFFVTSCFLFLPVGTLQGSDMLSVDTFNLGSGESDTLRHSCEITDEDSLLCRLSDSVTIPAQPLFEAQRTLQSSPQIEEVEVRKRMTFFQSIIYGTKRLFDEFNTFDTLYIEPQHYKFQAMGQMTNYYERYSLTYNDGERIEFSPDVSTVIGPYIGYSLIFLGYTLQLNNLYLGNMQKTFNLSLYTSLFGVDFYFRDNNKFRIKNLNIKLDNKKETEYINDQEFDGFHVKYWGFNLYYITKHRKHSYPAAYNQSTCQKKSAGSPLFGIGYGHYSITMDWQELDNMLSKYINGYMPQFTQTTLNGVMNYDCYSVYGGYSYNWVFARNWLFGTSMTMALSYNISKGESFTVGNIFNDFKLSNISLDGVGRMGIVWNNTRFFAGASAQIHSYTYSKPQIKINNLFGTINIYAGINFGKKKPYRKPGRVFEF